jgi:hypothetical protein
MFLEAEDSFISLILSIMIVIKHEINNNSGEKSIMKTPKKARYLQGMNELTTGC